MTLPKNLEVARKAKLKPLAEIAAEMGIGEHLLETYGGGVAKIKLDAIEELADRPRAKYVVREPARGGRRAMRSFVIVLPAADPAAAARG